MVDCPNDPRPDHRWSGDDVGHNCAQCPEGSIWRCDQLAHIRVAADLLSDEQRVDLRARLAESARVRRLAAGNASQIPLSSTAFGETRHNT